MLRKVVKMICHMRMMYNLLQYDNRSLDENVKCANFTLFVEESEKIHQLIMEDFELTDEDVANETKVDDFQKEILSIMYKTLIFSYPLVARRNDREIDDPKYPYGTFIFKYLRCLVPLLGRVDVTYKFCGKYLWLKDKVNDANFKKSTFIEPKTALTKNFNYSIIDWDMINFLLIYHELCEMKRTTQGKMEGCDRLLTLKKPTLEELKLNSSSYILHREENVSTLYYYNRAKKTLAKVTVNIDREKLEEILGITKNTKEGDKSTLTETPLDELSKIITSNNGHTQMKDAKKDLLVYAEEIMKFTLPKIHPKNLLKQHYFALIY